MSKYLPHHIEHKKLIVELNKADPSFPSKVKRILDVGDLLCKFYPGVHEAIFEDGSVYYIKNSDGLAKSFTFPCKNCSNAHVEIYDILRSYNFYHPKARFLCSEGEHGFRIISATPASKTVTNLKRRLKVFPTDLHHKHLEQITGMIPKKYLHGDINCSNNYGVIDDKLYYFDMHLFKRYPSPAIPELQAKLFTWLP